MSEFEEQIKRIQDKLATASHLRFKSSSAYLKDNDRFNYYRFFGAGKHLFRVNATLSPAQIDAWEAKHNASLPEGYRAFLEQIGDGGPCYGVLPLDHWDSGIYLDDEARREQSPSQPCLLINRFYERDTEEESWLAEIAGADWEEKLDRDEWWPTVGSITICEHGCGMYEYLIMNGPYRGQVFFMNWLDPPIFSKGNFLDWYESWLDRVLAPKPGG